MTKTTTTKTTSTTATAKTTTTSTTTTTTSTTTTAKTATTSTTTTSTSTTTTSTATTTEEIEEDYEDEDIGLPGKEKTSSEQAMDYWASLATALNIPSEPRAREIPVTQSPQGWPGRTIDLNVLVKDYKGRVLEGVKVKSLLNGEWMSESEKPTDEHGRTHLDVGLQAELEFISEDHITMEEPFDFKSECHNKEDGCMVMGVLQPTNWTRKQL